MIVEAFRHYATRFAVYHFLASTLGARLIMLETPHAGVRERLKRDVSVRGIAPSEKKDAKRRFPAMAWFNECDYQSPGVAVRDPVLSACAAIVAAFVLFLEAPLACAATVNDGSISTIVGVNAGLCLGVEGSIPAAGARLQSQICSGNDFQKWKFVKDPAGYVEFVNVGSGMCVDVTGGSFANDTTLQQWGCTGADWQKWNPSDQGSGQFAIISKYNGLALDVYGASTANGAPVVQRAWAGVDSQKWTFPLNGAPVVQQARAGGDSQTRTSPLSDGNTATSPMGFGAGTTGGAGGTVVHVSTGVELEYALCHTSNGGTCLDNDPRVIEIDSTIDLTNSEGTMSALGCHATQECAAPAKSEVTLVMYPWAQGYCQSKQTQLYNYFAAGLQGMLVGSNKTVIGVGSAAAIKGKGFLLQGGASNVIIRNLAITDINEGIVFAGDAITIANASKVWIDHNRFARIGRQMIVTGTGDHTGVADGITISNNEFDGTSAYAARCDGAHYWNLLLYGNGGVTLVGNWIHDFSGRAPRIMPGDAGTTVQIVNNLFQNGTWYALDYQGSSARILMEGNYFDKVGWPVAQPTDPGQLYGVYQQTTASRAACKAALGGRLCSGNIAVPAPVQDYLVQDQGVLDAMSLARTKLVKPYSASDVPARVKANAGNW